MGFQVAFESENVFAQSNVSRYREFQVDGAATEKARRASSVCMRGTMIIKARGRGQKLEAEAKGSQGQGWGQGQMLRDRGQNFGQFGLEVRVFIISDCLRSLPWLRRRSCSRQNKHFVASMKDLFDDVEAHSIIDFIKETRFYKQL